MQQMRAAEDAVQLEPDILINKLLAKLNQVQLQNAQLETLVEMQQAELKLLRQLRDPVGRVVDDAQRLGEQRPPYSVG